MNPENPQLDGQPLKIENAINRDSNSITLAFNNLRNPTPEIRKEMKDATENLSSVVQASSTDDLVHHHLNSSEPHWSVATELDQRTDVTPEQLTQLAMHSDEQAGHVASRHPQATDEHRALHFLSHPQCMFCDFERKKDMDLKSDILDEWHR